MGQPLRWFLWENSGRGDKPGISAYLYTVPGPNRQPEAPLVICSAGLYLPPWGPLPASLSRVSTCASSTVFHRGRGEGRNAESRVQWIGVQDPKCCCRGPGETPCLEASPAAVEGVGGPALLPRLDTSRLEDLPIASPNDTTHGELKCRVLPGLCGRDQVHTRTHTPPGLFKIADNIMGFGYQLTALQLLSLYFKSTQSCEVDFPFDRALTSYFMVPHMVELVQSSDHELLTCSVG